MIKDVVLLHAFPLDHRMWRDQQRALTAGGYRVLTPNYRGFGGNRQPLPTTPNLDTFADDVVTLLDECDIERAVVGGLSLGGYVTLNLLRRYPDRLAGLILADTRADADGPAALATRLAFADRVDAQGSDWVPAAVLPALLGAPAQADAALVAELSAWIRGNDPAAIAWTQRAMAARPDSFAALRAFDGPALVLVGDEDATTPVATVARIAAALPGAAPTRRFVQILSAGHLSAVEQPAAVTEVMLDWSTSLK